MSAEDHPEVRSTKKMRLNPEPLKVVKDGARCRKCGQTYGMRGKCVCLRPDPVFDAVGTAGESEG